MWPTRQKPPAHQRSRWTSPGQAVAAVPRQAAVPRRTRERKAAGVKRLRLGGTEERAGAEAEPAVWRTPSPIRFRCYFRCCWTLTGRGRGARHRPSPQWLLQQLPRWRSWGPETLLVRGPAAQRRPRPLLRPLPGQTRPGQARQPALPQPPGRGRRLPSVRVGRLLTNPCIGQARSGAPGRDRQPGPARRSRKRAGNGSPVLPT